MAPAISSTPREPQGDAAKWAKERVGIHPQELFAQVLTGVQQRLVF